MNPYDKLRPITDSEQCRCEAVCGLVLMYRFTRNPIHCLKCKDEIDPERLGLEMREIDDVARVMATHGALFDLWLQSGEYEEWAKQRLIDPKGQVNVDGMAIARKLSVKWPCYYLWFYDTEDGAPERCPSCGEFLDKSVLWATGKCYRCCVLM